MNIRRKLSSESFVFPILKKMYSFYIGWPCVDTIVRKLFDRNYFIDNEIQGKIFSWIHDYLGMILP